MDAIEAEVQRRLQTYKKSYEEEWAADLKKEKDKDFASIASLYPKAVSSLEWLLEHSESDSARFNAAKYIIDRKLGPINKVAPTDGLSELLEELRSP